MAANKIIFIGPTAMTTGVINLINPPAIASSGVIGLNGAAFTGNTYLIVRKITIVNKASAGTVSFWKGATGASAAGTEVIGSLLAIGAAAVYQTFEAFKLDVADFLTGQASANTTFVFSAEAEIGIA